MLAANANSNLFSSKLRAKLGLKPLEVGDASAAKSEGDSSKPKTIEEQEVFIRTENISEKKQAEKIRERLQTQKERRKIAEKLKTVKGLADSDSDDDTVSWIERSRQIEKAKAEAKAKALAEMDEEVEEQLKESEIRRKQQLYSNQHLGGLTVGHSQTTFREGEQVVLTLKDSEILDDAAEDVLVNVNMIDDEKAAENVLNKKKGTNVYNPYDDGEDGEGRSLLYKYDEEIEGKKKETFKIGDDAVSERIKIKQELAEMKKQLAISLDTESTRKIASEYYTPEEMLKFKKPKKKVKKVLRKRNIEEELVPIDKVAETSDHGSRSRRRAEEEPMETDQLADEVVKQEPVDSDRKKLNIADLDVAMKPVYDDDDTAAIVVDDDAQDELQAALERARRMNMKKKEAASIEKMADDIVAKRETDKADDQGGFLLNSTAEFCRTLGDIPTYGKAGNRDDFDEQELEEELREEVERSRREEEAAKPSSSRQESAWSQVDRDEESDRSVFERLKAEPILEEEPELTMGVAGALRLALNKGYIEKDEKKNVSAAPPSNKLNALNYTIEEKYYDDDKSRRRGAERYSGPVTAFQDKAGYKPDVKLDYADEHGRLLTPKEAFRVLSHKFHGKGPGKNKVDKRTKKLEQESKLRQMSSIDTPLNTVQKLQEKQKELNTPYVILTGNQ